MRRLPLQGLCQVDTISRLLADMASLGEITSMLVADMVDKPVDIIRVVVMAEAGGYAASGSYNQGGGYNPGGGYGQTGGSNQFGGYNPGGYSTSQNNGPPLR